MRPTDLHAVILRCQVRLAMIETAMVQMKLDLYLSEQETIDTLTREILRDAINRVWSADADPITTILAVRKLWNMHARMVKDND